MKDKILESLTQNFAKEYSLDNETESAVFEHFVNYCVVSKYTTEDIDLEVVHTGGKGDPSIDGIATIVNGHVIADPEEVSGIKKVSPRMETDFVFIQSKTSPNFDSGEILGFMHGISEFLAKDATVVKNERIRNHMEIRDAIISEFATAHRNPACHIFYVTTGQWKDEDLLLKRIERQKDEIKSTNLFSSVDFYPVDSAKLQSFYRQLRRKIECDVDFPKRTALPLIKGVDQAYIGVLHCKEYLKLVTDSDGNIQRQIFYENIRDFQGDNTVNLEIEATLKDNEKQQQFSLLNNGVTIIARSIVQRADTLKISDYQIVNGCQTSNVLFRNRKFLTDTTSLPVRLIVTEDSKIIGDIVKATNRQTEVKIEAFEALSSFHRKLEDYYEAMKNAKHIQLYYERRSRQYSNLNIGQRHIVSLATQVTAFLAMFLEEPHSTHRYYGELIKAYRPRLFQEDHQLSPYFASSLALRTLDEMLYASEIDKKYWMFRHHLILIFRIISTTSDIPRLNSNDAQRLGERLTDICVDKPKAKEMLIKSSEILKLTLRKTTLERGNCDRIRTFTEELITVACKSAGLACSKSMFKNSPGELRNGKIKAVFPYRGFGFISDSDDPDVCLLDVYFHFSSVQDLDLKKLLDTGKGIGLKVDFCRHKNDRGFEAQEVKKRISD